MGGTTAPRANPLELGRTGGLRRQGRWAPHRHDPLGQLGRLLLLDSKKTGPGSSSRTVWYCVAISCAIVILVFTSRPTKAFLARGMILALLLYFIPLALCPYACLGEVCPWMPGAAHDRTESGHGGCCDPGHPESEGFSERGHPDADAEPPATCGGCDGNLTSPVPIVELSPPAPSDSRRLDFPLDLLAYSIEAEVMADPPHLRSPVPDQSVISREPFVRPTGRAPPLA